MLFASASVALFTQSSTSPSAPETAFTRSLKTDPDTIIGLDREGDGNVIALHSGVGHEKIMRQLFEAQRQGRSNVRCGSI